MIVLTLRVCSRVLGNMLTSLRSARQVWRASSGSAIGFTGAFLAACLWLVASSARAQHGELPVTVLGEQSIPWRQLLGPNVRAAALPGGDLLLVAEGSTSTVRRISPAGEERWRLSFRVPQPSRAVSVRGALGIGDANDQVLFGSARDERFSTLPPEIPPRGEGGDRGLGFLARVSADGRLVWARTTSVGAAGELLIGCAPAGSGLQCLARTFYRADERREQLFLLRISAEGHVLDRQLMKEAERFGYMFRGPSVVAGPEGGIVASMPVVTPDRDYVVWGPQSTLELMRISRTGRIEIVRTLAEEWGLLFEAGDRIGLAAGRSERDIRGERIRAVSTLRFLDGELREAYGAPCQIEGQVTAVLWRGNGRTLLAVTRSRRPELLLVDIGADCRQRSWWVDETWVPESARLAINEHRGGVVLAYSDDSGTRLLRLRIAD